MRSLLLAALVATGAQAAPLGERHIGWAPDGPLHTYQAEAVAALAYPGAADLVATWSQGAYMLLSLGHSCADLIAQQDASSRERVGEAAKKAMRTGSGDDSDAAEALAQEGGVQWRYYSQACELIKADVVASGDLHPREQSRGD